MAVGLNQVTLIGNVEKDLAIRTTGEGKEIAAFVLATTEAWKDRHTGAKKERKEFHKIAVFHEGIVNVVKNFVECGSKLYLQGNLQTRKWVDAAGHEKYTTEVVLQNQSAMLMLLGPKQSIDLEHTSNNDTTNNDTTSETLNHNEPGVGLNQVTLIGNVGKNLAIRTTTEGKEIAVFTFATTETWKDRNTGAKKERTEWHRIVIFHEGIVNVVKNFVKCGSKLYLQGNLQTRKWVDAAGHEKYTTEVVLQNQSAILMLLDTKPSVYREHTSNNDTTNETFNHNELDDEIPF